MKFVSVACLIITTACSGNILTSFANQKTDDALLTNAKIQINQKNYAQALQNFSQMTAKAQATPAVLEVQASAYAGLGGLDFLSLANAVPNIGAITVTTFLMRTFTNGTTDTAAAFLNAESTMTKISADFANLTADENIELAAIELAHVGTILSRVADANADGTVDTGFDPCSTASLTDADATEVGYALNYTMGAIGQATTDGVNFASAAASVNTVCSTIAGLPAPYSNYNFCGVLRGTSFTADQLIGIRSMLKENTVGLGTCAGSIVTCHC